MKNGLFTLSWGNVRSALVYALLMGLLALLNYITTKFELNAQVLAGIGLVASLIKNFLTTNAGNVVGLVDTKA